MSGQDLLDQEQRVEEIREEIHEKFPHVEWPEPVLEPIYYGKLTKTKVPARLAVLDANTGKVWDIVSGNYSLLPHEKALHDILVGLPKEMGEPKVDIRLWAEGARFRADIMFPEIKKGVPIKVGDVVEPRLSVGSSYDRKQVHYLQESAVQMVCGNGLVCLRNGNKNKRKHIFGSHVTPEMIAKLAENFIEEYSISTEQWKHWANTQLSRVQIVDAFEHLPFSEPERDRILNLPLMNGGGMLSAMEKPTLWDLNSAATQFAKHEVRGEQRSVDLETDIASAMAIIEKGI